METSRKCVTEPIRQVLPVMDLTSCNSEESTVSIISDDASAPSLNSPRALEKDLILAQSDHSNSDESPPESDCRGNSTRNPSDFNIGITASDSKDISSFNDTNPKDTSANFPKNEVHAVATDSNDSSLNDTSSQLSNPVLALLSSSSETTKEIQQLPNPAAPISPTSHMIDCISTTFGERFLQVMKDEGPPLTDFEHAAFYKFLDAKRAKTWQKNTSSTSASNGIKCYSGGVNGSNEKKRDRNCCRSSTVTLQSEESTARPSSSSSSTRVVKKEISATALNKRKQTSAPAGNYEDCNQKADAKSMRLKKQRCSGIKNHVNGFTDEGNNVENNLEEAAARSLIQLGDIDTYNGATNSPTYRNGGSFLAPLANDVFSPSSPVGGERSPGPSSSLSWFWRPFN